MGDRGQICIEYGPNQRVYFYTHWQGTEIPETLQNALRRGRDRWTDSEYLARIIFDVLVNDHHSTTGFGIGLSQHGDVEHPIPIVDIPNQQIRWEADDFGNVSNIPQMSFAEFCAYVFESK